MLQRKTGVATNHRMQPPLLGAVHETVARRVYREFVNTPDLRVTVGEAQGRFGLKENECEMVLECLTEFGVLTRLPGGCYAKPVSE